MGEKNTRLQNSQKSEEKMIYHELARVSAKLLEPSIRQSLPTKLWEEAFEACASGSEWEEFCRARQHAPEWPLVKNLCEHSPQPFSKPKKSVTLPPLDTSGHVH